MEKYLAYKESDDDIEEYGAFVTADDRYFMFLVGGTLCAVDVLCVVEIMELPHITKVPMMSDFVVGVTNIRGEIVGVVDLRKRFGFFGAKSGKKTSVAIIKTSFGDKTEKVAVVIDEVFEIDVLKKDSFAPPLLFGTDIEYRFIKHMAVYNQKDTIVLDIKNILDLSELSVVSVPPQATLDDKTVGAISNESTKEVMRAKQEDEFLDVDNEEDEFDILRLISINKNDSNQYLIFLGKDGRRYAKNVAKIEEVISIFDADIVKNYDGGVVLGSVAFRDEVLPLVGFDAWLGYLADNFSDYKEMLVLNYGGTKFALAVAAVECIVSIAPEEMKPSFNANQKSNFMAKIEQNGVQSLCVIVDSDRMLKDCFADDYQESVLFDSDVLESAIHTKRTLFFADDSKYMRHKISDVVSRLGLKAKIYENGKALLDGLAVSDENDIALIVTDIEMPLCGGRKVIESLRADPKYDKIKIIACTNMANRALEDELVANGANRVIDKTDIAILAKTFAENVR